MPLKEYQQFFYDMGKQNCQTLVFYCFYSRSPSFLTPAKVTNTVYMSWGVKSGKLFSKYLRCYI